MVFGLNQIIIDFFYEQTLCANNDNAEDFFSDENFYAGMISIF